MINLDEFTVCQALRSDHSYDHFIPNKQVLPDPSLGLNQLRGFHTDVEFLSKEGASKINLSSHFGNTISESIKLLNILLFVN